MEKAILSPRIKNESLTHKLQCLSSDSLEYVVDWMVKNEGIVRAKAENARNEFLKFFSLSILSDGDLIFKNPIVPSEDADEFWHNFLLFNNRYTDWCIRHFGKVINHLPGEATSDGWKATQNAINEYYGEEWNLAGTSSAALSEFVIGGSHW